MSGLAFADHFVCIPKTPEGLQTQIEKALLIEYTRKWRVTANIRTCAVVIRHEYKKCPVHFKWGWGAYGFLVVDQYSYLGKDTS